MPNERAGRIAQDIINEFYLDKATYEDLAKQYNENIVKGSKLIKGLRNRIVERFPERQIDLRHRLLKLYSESNNQVRKIIESEIFALYEY
jgi:hypothetical protein